MRNRILQSEFNCTKTACSASKMALEGAPCGPSMKTSSGGRFFEWVVTGRGMEAAGLEVVW